LDVLFEGSKDRFCDELPFTVSALSSSDPFLIFQTSTHLTGLQEFTSEMKMKAMIGSQLLYH
jgi:hypothetical protein